VDFEILQLITLEDRLSDAYHARFQLIDGKGRGRGGQTDAKEGQQAEESSGRADVHGYAHPEDTVKPMKSQGTSGIPVDTSAHHEVPSKHLSGLMPRFFSPFVSHYASYWWWYGTVTEGANSGV
jgi:hypothetical protein